MSEMDLQNEINKIRPADPYWQNVSCIQMTPNSKIGLGKYFRFTFSPIIIDKPEK